LDEKFKSIESKIDENLNIVNESTKSVFEFRFIKIESDIQNLQDKIVNLITNLKNEPFSNEVLKSNSEDSSIINDLVVNNIPVLPNESLKDIFINISKLLDMI